MPVFRVNPSRTHHEPIDRTRHRDGTRRRPSRAAVTRAGVDSPDIAVNRERVHGLPRVPLEATPDTDPPRTRMEPHPETNRVS